MLREVSVSRVMTAKVWRERMIYAAMSLFVAWHTLAMIVAPAPGESDLIKGLRIVLDPYLHFLRLDNSGISLRRTSAKKAATPSA